MSGKKTVYRGTHLGIPQRFVKHFKKFYFNSLGFTSVSHERFRAFRKIIESLKISPNTILDAGCGDGICSFWLARRFPHSKIFACDVDEEYIAKNLELNQEFGLGNIHFFTKDLIDLDFHEKFDLVVCMEVLQVVRDDKKVIKNLAQSLTKEGLLFVHCPMWPPNYSYFGYINNPPTRARSGYDEEGIKEMLRENGLGVLKMGYTFNRFGSLAWEIGRIMQKHRIRIFISPFLPLIAALDSLTKKNKGNWIWFLAKKE